MTTLEATLIDSRDALLGYARKQTGDPDLAADAVQASMLKALEAAPTLHDDDRLLPWLYRILDNTIIDLYRRRSVATKHRSALAEATETTVEPDDYTRLCRCMEAVLPAMNPDYAFLISSLELGDQDPQAVADHLGITRNNLKVKRHRARQQLKQRLEETCRTCATHGCLDCSCGR